MAEEKRSINEMTEKKGLHLQTLDADINLEDMYGEDRKKKEKALVRKVDIRMMPLMMLLCVLKLACGLRSRSLIS
jgi:hypothetical protein